MSVSVKARLRGHVMPEDIINYLNQKKKITASIKVERKYCGLEGYVDYGCILLDDVKYDNIFYFYSDFCQRENYDFWVSKGLKDMVETETTQLSMYCSEDDVKLMKQIVLGFGGWIDEDDSDEEYFYPVMKNPGMDVKPIRHVTMQEVYEKFGGIVIIDNSGSMTSNCKGL